MQSVKIGRRPSEITTDPKILLQFCLQNVFNSLPIESKTVASALAVLSGTQSIASLAFFTELDSLNVQSSLSVLITSNLVASERGRSSEDEDRFMLSALARLYIQKFLKPNVDEQKRLIAKQNVLRSAQEEYQARIGTDIFDINFVYVRDKDDYIVASMLSRAIDLAFRQKVDAATQEVERAASLSPNYFEVHRVRAFVATQENDFFTADTEFEAAISLAPTRAPLRLWYGGFLLRYVNDTERAMVQLLEAESLDPSAPSVKLECARALQYQRRFEEADDRLDAIAEIEKLPARTRRVHLDLRLQNQFRQADFLNSREMYSRALDCLERARVIFEQAPAGLLDNRTFSNLNRARRNLVPLRRAFKGLSEMDRLKDFEQWLVATLFPSSPQKNTDIDTPQHALTISDDDLEATQHGKLTNLQDNYGFIAVGTTSFFFHKGAWKSRTIYTTALEGQVASFSLKNTDRGLRAKDVILVNDDIDESAFGQVFEGLILDKQGTFGFVRSQDVGDVFFHRSDCVNAYTFGSLIPGRRVGFTYRRKEDGRVHAALVHAFPEKRN